MRRLMKAAQFALAVPGRLVLNDFDRVAALHFTFEAAGGEAGPLVYIPEHRHPGGFAVEVDGVETAVTVDAATRRALVSWNGKPGRHDVNVRPRPQN
jgi:hypothetical protein